MSKIDLHFTKLAKLSKLIKLAYLMKLKEHFEIDRKTKATKLQNSLNLQS